MEARQRSYFGAPEMRAIVLNLKRLRLSLIINIYNTAIAISYVNKYHKTSLAYLSPGFRTISASFSFLSCKGNTIKMLRQECYKFRQIISSLYQIFLMNQYSMASKLGEGAFSVVYRVKRKEDGCQYAMKKIRISTLSEKQLANCLNQVRILASIQHPNILSYKDSFYDQIGNCFCIVTQCLQGGDVFQMINRHKANKKIIDQNTIWQVAYQTLQGLSTLHQMNILHRDIKCANIFLNKDKSQVKLADMNVSIVTANGMAKTQTGTPYYASPEVWLEKPYSAKCDIWSLGCVLYEMAAQRPPFVSHDLKSLKKTIIGGIYKRIPIQYSTDLQNFIRLCLKVDPKERPSASQLMQSQLLKNRITLKNHLIQNSITQNSSGLNSKKLIGKINIPKRRDFRNIKEMLPKHRFGQSSVDKIVQNKSMQLDEKNKENILSFINSGKITRKDQLPNIKRSSSMNSKQQTRPKIEQKVLPCEQRPPLPKKPMRA